ncbi:MAG TPA: M28 family peptidase [Burkholderiales bacterium]|nr:M28 family peptidase [Burkholderiales bacterium]
MPGRSHDGPLPPLTQEERELAERLRRHVSVLAESERNADLERPARYIESAFKAHGVAVESDWFVSRGRKVRNLQTPGPAAIVVGAHYDSVFRSPGANDNASGVAVVIELAALLRNPGIRFIAFANEESPYFRGPDMGSWHSAQGSRQRGEPLRAMLSLEMLGYYRDEPGSQRYPPPLSLLYPDRANFIAFVGDLGSRELVRRTIASFRRHAQFPSEGVAAPAIIPGIDWSDHWSFRQHGYPAMMVTDTAFNRYPHYHEPSDTADKLDYERMARVTLGLAAAIKELSR